MTPHPDLVAVTAEDRALLEFIYGGSFKFKPAAERRALAAIAAHRLEYAAPLAREIELLRDEKEQLRKIALPEWFYPADGYESESCHDSVDEVIEYLDLHHGGHVVEVNCATSLPSVWCAVEVLTLEQMEEREDDERVIIREFATEAEARAALKEAPAP